MEATVEERTRRWRREATAEPEPLAAVVRLVDKSSGSDEAPHHNPELNGRRVTVALFRPFSSTRQEKDSSQELVDQQTTPRLNLDLSAHLNTNVLFELLLSCCCCSVLVTFMSRLSVPGRRILLCGSS